MKRALTLLLFTAPLAAQPIEIPAAPAPLVELAAVAELAPCEAGGQQLRAGLDLDGDGALSENEVQQELAVCDGPSGGAGADGALPALALSTAPASLCPAGGTLVSIGDDALALCDGLSADAVITLDALDCGEGERALFDGGDWRCAPDDDSLGALVCGDGQIAKFAGLAWTCGDDLSSAAEFDTLAQLACSPGQLAKFDGAAWACADDVDTDTDTDLLGTLACTDGQLARFDGADWRCADDADTDTDTDTLGGLICGPGQLAAFDGAAWLCADDKDTDTDTLATLSCAAGQLAKFNGAGWGCADDTDTDTDTDILAALSCAADQIARFDGADWSCDDDRLTVSGADSDVLGALVCAPGQLAKFDGADWSCGDDIDTDTDTDTLATLACGADQIARFDGIAWACDNDRDTDLDTVATLSCSAGQIARFSGGVWTCSDDVDTDTDTDTLASLSCAEGQIAKAAGGGWACGDDTDTDTDTDTLAALLCGAGQIARFDGAAWFCGDDQDANTDTLAGLSCAEGEIAEFSGGVWGCATDDSPALGDDTLGQLTCTSDQIARFVSGAWVCSDDADTDEDTLGGLSCASGELAKSQGGSFVCGADVDTDILAALGCAAGTSPVFRSGAFACESLGGGGGLFTTTIFVPAAGTAQDNGDALNAAALGCVGASSTDRRAILLEAGFYDVGTTVDLPPFCDLSGAGKRATTLVSGAETAVTAARDTTIRDLTIDAPTGVECGDLGPANLERVRFLVQDAAGYLFAPSGVDVDVDAAHLDDVEVDLQAGFFAKGIEIGGAGDVFRINRFRAFATGQVDAPVAIDIDGDNGTQEVHIDGFEVVYRDIDSFENCGTHITLRDVADATLRRGDLRFEDHVPTCGSGVFFVNASARVTGVRVVSENATASAFNVGGTSEVDLVNVDARLECLGSFSGVKGLGVTQGTARASNSRFEIFGAGTSTGCEGVDGFRGFSGIVDITLRSSEIVSTVRAVSADRSSTVRVFDSRLSGDVVVPAASGNLQMVATEVDQVSSPVGTLTCLNVYDDAFAAFSCP